MTEEQTRLDRRQRLGASDTDSALTLDALVEERDATQRLYDQESQDEDEAALREVLPRLASRGGALGAAAADYLRADAKVAELDRRIAAGERAVVGLNEGMQIPFSTTSASAAERRCHLYAQEAASSSQ